MAGHLAAQPMCTALRLHQRKPRKLALVVELLNLRQSPAVSEGFSLSLPQPTHTKASFRKLARLYLFRSVIMLFAPRQICVRNQICAASKDLPSPLTQLRTWRLSKNPKGQHGQRWRSVSFHSRVPGRAAICQGHRALVKTVQMLVASDRLARNHPSHHSLADSTSRVSLRYLG